MSIAKFFDGLGEFADFLEASALRSGMMIDVTAAAAAKLVEKNVKRLYGESPPLAPISQDSTAQLRSDGGAGGPLLIDGSLLRDSIESHSEGGLAGVGSAEPIVAYHEHGYVTAPNSMIPNKVVPPRPVLKEGMMESIPEVLKLSEESIGAMFGVTPFARIAEE
jgi:phage gpG-like protein